MIEKYSEVDVTRKLLSLILYIACSALSSCLFQPHQHGSVQTVTPNLTAARFNSELGIHYLQLNQIDLAQEKFNLALQQAPNDPLVLDALGFYYEKTGALDLANQYYFNALLTAPNSGTILSNYGFFLCRNGNASEGIAYLFQSIKIPNYIHAKKSYIYARACLEKLHKNASDNAEYNYYKSKL